MTCNLPIESLEHKKVIASSVIGDIDETINTDQLSWSIKNVFSFMSKNKIVFRKGVAIMVSQNEKLSLETK